MRPRKREPKPQPLDGTSTSSTSGLSKSPVAGPNSLLDKSKMMQSGGGGVAKQQSLKTPPSFPSTSPNGLKVPAMFDAAAMAQLQYPSPFAMWPPHGFPGIPAASQAAAAAAAAVQPPTFPPNADSIFTQHMMQRLQAESTASGGGVSGKNGRDVTPKSTRELAESLYDAGSTNGSSFLDGIIRHSLDKKPAEMNHGALFDQLVKNNRLAEPSDPAALVAAVHAKKRPATSPLSFAQQPDIKKERASPSESGGGTLDSKEDFTKEAVENLIKLREGLSLKMELAAAAKPDDLNGSSNEDGGGCLRTTDDSS